MSLCFFRADAPAPPPPAPFLLLFLLLPSRPRLPGPQVLRRLYDVINVLESIDLLERSLSVKRGVQWKGPSLTDVALPPGCPRVEPTRFKDLLRKQPMRKRAAAELLAVQNKKPRIQPRGARRSAHAARGAVFARLEDPMRRDLHQALEEIESRLLWQPPRVYTLMWHIYAAVGRHAHPVRIVSAPPVPPPGAPCVRPSTRRDPPCHPLPPMPTPTPTCLALTPLRNGFVLALCLESLTPLCPLLSPLSSPRRGRAARLFWPLRAA